MNNDDKMQSLMMLDKLVTIGTAYSPAMFNAYQTFRQIRSRLIFKDELIANAMPSSLEEVIEYMTSENLEPEIDQYPDGVLNATYEYIEGYETAELIYIFIGHQLIGVVIDGGYDYYPERSIDYDAFEQWHYNRKVAELKLVNQAVMGMSYTYSKSSDHPVNTGVSLMTIDSDDAFQVQNIFFEKQMITDIIPIDVRGFDGVQDFLRDYILTKHNFY